MNPPAPNPMPLAEFMDESVYRRLHYQAKAILRREAFRQRLEPSDLVHEAFVRIARSHAPVHFQSASHLMALTTIVMRRILIDAARAADSPLWLGCVPLDSGLPLASPAATGDAEPLHEALRYMRTCDARLYRIVMMRFFWGLGIEEIAAALSISARTVKRDWKVARDWLRRELFIRSGALRTRDADQRRN